MKRNVPKLRFKGFNDELKKEKFQNLVTLQRGSSPRPIIKYITTSEDGVNWIKIGDVSTGKTFIDKTAEKITKEGAEKSRKVQVGDLILSNSMSFGRPYIMKIDGYIHDGWFVLKNYQKNFNREYLCQLLTSPIIQKQYKRLAAGGVVNNISSELVNAVIVNVPSLQEQERIANFLTKVDKIIEKQDEKVKNLEKYKKGMMQKIFSQEIRFKDENGNEYPEWQKMKLKDVANRFEYGMNSASTEFDGKNKYIRITDIDENTYKYKNDNIVSPEGVLEDKYLVNENDILFTRTGASVGKTYLYDKNDGRLYFAGFLIRVNVNEDNNSRFIFLQTQTNEYKRWVKIMSMRSGQPGINSQEYGMYNVNIPCIDEQNKIANVFEKIDSIIQKENDKNKKLHEFKKGLLQQMFA